MIFQPLRPFIINQHFGENNACVNKLGHVITKPVGGCPNGYRSLYGKEGHKGLDLKSEHGQPVYCAQRGRVYHIDTLERSGLDVRVETNIDGRRIRHIYEHLLGYQPKVGDWVETGQLIGWADNTGYSSGDHLHFQVEEHIDGKWKAIDPLSIMEPRFAKDILAINNTILYIREQIALLADVIADKLR